MYVQESARQRPQYRPMAMTIDGPRSAEAVDDTWPLQTTVTGYRRGGATPRGGDGRCGGWRQRLIDATREEAVAAGGGAMHNAKMVCGVSLRGRLYGIKMKRNVFNFTLKLSCAFSCFYDFLVL